MAKNTNGKTTRTRTAKAKPDSAERLRLEAEDVRAHNQARVVAAAWVAAIRVKVRELAREASVIDNIIGHPDKMGQALVLRCVLNPDGAALFMQTVYELEDMLDDLLAGDAEPTVPDLADACQKAAETHAALYAGRLKATEVA